MRNMVLCFAVMLAGCTSVQPVQLTGNMMIYEYSADGDLKSLHYANTEHCTVTELEDVLLIDRDGSLLVIKDGRYSICWSPR